MQYSSWRIVSSRALYLHAAEELRRNSGQWAAYNSNGHCIVLAGPGSGKTKTLTIKMARMLAEDVEEPRGLACITYSNECARELEQRLDALGVAPGERVFIGTVHSFSLTQIVMPYAKPAALGLPDEFRVATQREQRIALERAFRRTIDSPDNPQRWNIPMGRYRRSILDRNSDQWRTADPEMASLVEAYEDELRRRGLIDFDDMPLLAVRALRENEWLQRAILAKYPILVVDEYQDLGRALHRMVMGLCFSTGIRLFAVGDVDQSIYGFMGAFPEVLQRLSKREDVETIPLRLNYRCGSRIVTASQYALGQDRGYAAPDDAAEGTIYFHPRQGGHVQQADYLFDDVLPAAIGRMPAITLGKIAILYASAGIGDAVADAAQRHGYGFVRTDTNALYPRSSRLMRWLELCAMWCCGGWRSGEPRFSKVVGEGCRTFAELLNSDEERNAFQSELLTILWARRDSTMLLRDWLIDLRELLLADLISESRTLDEEGSMLDAFIERTADGRDAGEFTLGVFSGHGEGNDRLNLSTLHSAKSREFQLVVLFGMDQGNIPWNNLSESQLREWRRLFYVGFTRAESELHIMYSAARPSIFVRKVQERLAANE